MAEPSTSLTQHVTPLALEGSAVCAGFLGRTPAVGLAEGSVLLAEIGAEKRIELHPEALAQGAEFVSSKELVRRLTAAGLRRPKGRPAP